MNKLCRVPLRRYRGMTVVISAAVITFVLLSWLTQSIQAQAFPPPGAGYLDYPYGANVGSSGRTPTESKPESKLWWNDGYWWGSLFSPTANQYHIYRLNWGTQTWEDTGVAIDDRLDSRADVLWDGTKLYVASHFAQLNASDTNNSVNYARLYRYSYNITTHTYAPDAGFPVNINHDKTEALVLAKDPVNGRLWITYVSRLGSDATPKYKVYVNASGANDGIWNINAPLDLTTLSTISDTARVSVDDIAAIVAFKDNGGDKVGILWSNQRSIANTSLNFAWHAVTTGNFDADWVLQPLLNALGGTSPQSKANDHMNVKSLQVGASGQVFAAIKFENQVFNPNKPDFPEIGLLARDVDGTFSYHTYSKVSDNDSRPLLLIDEGDTANPNDTMANLFVSGLPQGSKICTKSLAIPAPPTPLSTMANFAPGNCGTNFIVDASGVYTTFRDPSSTKQNVNSTTGIVVLAADVNQRAYAHNTMGNPPPVVTAYGPTAASLAITGVVTATFSKPIASASLNNSTFLVLDGATPVAGTVTYNVSNRTATFTSSSALKANTTYTVQLTNGIQDTTGLGLDAFKTPSAGGLVEQWTFVTGLTTAEFSLPSYSVLENAGHAVITVTLASPASQPVTVHYATSNDTALAGINYTASSGDVTFAPGDLAKTFSVPILNDNAATANKTINLTLSNVSGATAGAQRTSVLTIIDVNSPPTVQFSPTSYEVNEGNATVTIIVSLNHPSASDVTIHYTATDGKATAPADYQVTNGDLMIKAGNPSGTFLLPIVDDTVYEADETVNLTLSNPSAGATLGAGGDKATVTIHDNDPEPTVQFDAAPYTVDESAGTVNVTVKLSSASSFAVTVDYDIVGNTAIVGQDYTAANSSLTFAPGETTKTFPITLLDNTLSEADETIDLSLSGIINATPGVVQTILTIHDNDLLPTVQFNADNYHIAENGTKATIAVQLSSVSGQAVEVNYISSDNTATAGKDYVGVDDSLIIPAGVISATFEVLLVNDTVAEATETANLALNTPVNATLGATTLATLTILDDDEPVVPTVQFSNSTYSVNEAAGTATVTVTLSAATVSNVTVTYSSSNGSATAGQDYTAVNGTVSFAAGQKTKLFTVPIIQDTVDEANEMVNLTLTNPNKATVGTPANAVLTILDDDEPVTSTTRKVYLPLIKR